MLSTPRTIVNIILSLIFFIFALPALFLLPAEITLFHSAPFKEALSSEGVYPRVPDLASEFIFDQGGMFISERYEQRAVEYMKEEDYRQIIRLIMPVQWVESQSDTLLVQLWDFLNFRKPEMALMVDLRAVKSRFVNEESSNIVNIIIATWPPCGIGDALQFGAMILNGDINQVPICQPPAITMPLAQKMVQGFMPVFVSKIPDQVNLIDNIEISREDLVQLEYVFSIYRVLRLLWYLTPLISLLLLALIGFVARTSIWKALNWMGLQLVQVGISGILTAGIILFMSFYFASNFAKQFQISALAALMTSLVKVIMYVINQFAIFGGMISVGVTGLGLIMMTLAIIRLRQK